MHDPVTGEPFDVDHKGKGNSIQLIHSKIEKKLFLLSNHTLVETLAASMARIGQTSTPNPAPVHCRQ